MKSRIAPLMIMLLTLSALIMAGCKPAQEQLQPSAQKTANVKRIEISEYGTLKRLLSADGKSLPAEQGKTLDEGYAIAYQYTPSKGKTVKEFVYALGDEHSSNLEVVQAGGSASSGEVAKAVTKTQDGMLQLTHQFIFNEQNGVVEVRRTIKCLAKDGVQFVQLLRVKLLTDNLLSSGAQAALTSKSEDLASDFTGVGYYHPQSDCGPRCPGGMPCRPPVTICDPPPPCLINPDCNPGLKLLQGMGVIRPLDIAKQELEENRTSQPSGNPPTEAGKPYATIIVLEFGTQRGFSQIKPGDEGLIAEGIRTKLSFSR